MKGFKSFAAKSDLNFEPGTTVIVGPNGSGKSNIVDAFLWVTGEQSARSLRSTKMQDVIFAGSAQKSPMGVSEVTLTFDNGSRVFPIDYGEVAFTRRLYKSGESEYLLNGSACRLADINELLVHTNMGREMYSIIGQGRLDSILNSRPDERRVLIEEAAGLAKYKRRKEKALRKLAATERNLVRVRDILAEIRRQLKPLETQAKVAKDHKSLVDTLRTAEAEYIVRELADLTKIRDRQKMEAEAADKRLVTTAATAAAGREQIARLETLLTETLARLESLKDRRFSLATNAERLRGRVGVLREKENNLRLVGERFVDEAAGLAAELTALLEEKNNLATLLADAEKALARADEQNPITLTTAAAQEDSARLEAAARIVTAKVQAEEAFLAQLADESTPAKKAWPAGISGYLWDLIEIESGQEAAVEKLLGRRLSALVGRDVASARRIIESGGEWPAIYIGALAPAPVSGAESVPGLTCFTVFVKAKGLDERIYEALFGAAFLAEDLDVALKHAAKAEFDGAVFLTAAGETINGGLATPRARGTEDILVRQRRLEDLRTEIVALDKQRAAAEKAQGTAMAAQAKRDYALAPWVKEVAARKIQLQVMEERERVLRQRSQAAGVRVAARSEEAPVDGAMMRAEAETLANVRQLIQRLTTVINRYETMTEEEIARSRTTERQTREELSGTRRQLAEVDKQIALIENDRHREEISEAQLEPKISALIDQLEAEFSLTPAAAVKAYPEPRVKEELLSVMRDARAKIDYMGPINPIAAEEFAEVQERQEHLETQTQDLRRSERSLHKVIGLMDTQMSEKFLEIFNRVNESFQEVFKNMFPDGKAQLILTDPDDIMATGIEIEAQPSGRRLKKVSLLSGGESAMTALALLFGLFQINPAPFYLLDEADVALDDVNLQRFVALIKRFKNQAQFLIVTHQRRTMEVADILYGVTMQKDGVSKVLSQKLEEATV